MGSPEAKRSSGHNRFGHPVRIFPNVAIPEPKDTPAERLKKIGAALIISGRLQMLASIKLDCQLGCAASEV